MAVLLAWWSLRPATYHLTSIKGVAMKAASGDPQAIASLKGLGANAIPALVELLQYQEPFVRRRAWALAPRLPRRLGRGKNASKPLREHKLPRAAHEVSGADTSPLTSCAAPLPPNRQLNIARFLTSISRQNEYVVTYILWQNKLVRVKNGGFGENPTRP